MTFFDESVHDKRLVPKYLWAYESTHGPKYLWACP